MMDSLKHFFSPKRFSTPAYVCVILHSICGVILIAFTTNLQEGETEKFSCAVDTTFATHKDNVEETCLKNYNDVYNSPVRLYGFVLLSFGSVAFVSLIYVLFVGSRVDEVEKYFEGGNDGAHLLNGRNQPGTRTLYVFYFYFFHLVARAIFGVLFTILQFTVLYDWSGFDSEFSCIYTEQTQPCPDLNITSVKNASVPQSMVTCINPGAQDKQSCSYAVFGCNVIFTPFMLLEVIDMIKHLTKRERFPYFKPKSWSQCDFEFIAIYFLRKRKRDMPENIPLMGIDIPTPNPVQIYKDNILNDSLTFNINNGLDTDTNLDEIFIDAVIETEQAPLKFSKDMTRHEINDVYMKVSEHSIRIEEVKDLFHPNTDTKGNPPRTILVLGRPGIGKTVLTRKIMRDWARPRTDKFYHGKIAFFFKFRWFHFEQLQHLTLKKFLQLGTELSEDAFESIFQEIWENPQNAIFVFDGFDEYLANLQKFQDFLDQSKMRPNHSTSPMSATFLFIKILSSQILEGATVLVTSRPTAIDVLSELHFDRKVEIIGFTEEKIENYVEKFCASREKNELKEKIWNHIESLGLKNLCYIPVNCFIVCFTLLEHLTDKGDDSALPTTLTGLYDRALRYFKHRSRDLPKEHYQKVIKELQQLAFDGIKIDQLIFDGEFEQMEKSGLLHRLPVPICQPQACFIHLTVQEFLAAKHIVETKKPEDIEEFITSHVEHGKWHLVLQFLAGLLGKKMKMCEEYKSCVLAFREHLQIEIEIRIQGEDTVYAPSADRMLMMKCLRETESEDIAEEVVMKSALKDVTLIFHSGESLSRSDWAALVFVCKRLKRLKHLFLSLRAHVDCVVEITNLLRHRCLERLIFTGCRISPVQEVLEHLLTAITSQCRINHEHSKLAHLNLSDNGITDAGLSRLTEFLKDGHRICLKELRLEDNDGITSNGIYTFRDVLGYEACKQLAVLDFDDCRNVGDDGVRFLCDALEAKQHGLKKLSLLGCSLTAESTSWLGQLLSDEHCEITHLQLGSNDLRDEGVRKLCDGFRQGQRKLDVLSICYCLLTHECMPYLSKVFGDEMCIITDLSLEGNKNIGDKGASMLFDGLRVKQSSLTKLDLAGCGLTKECMSSLCGALGDGHCQLTYLRLQGNDIGDEGVEMLCCALGKEQCKLTKLNLWYCSLTDKCIPSLSEALGKDSCRLTELIVTIGCLGRFDNKFSSGGKKSLKDMMESEHCRRRGLRIIT